MLNPIVLDRRLAIRLLHEAQLAAPAMIQGVVGARDGVPTGFAPREEQLTAQGQQVWAWLSTHPTSGAEPDATELQEGRLHLRVSLGIKGVLELRAWQLHLGRVSEIPLAIRD